MEVVGVWSHLAAADEPGHPSVALQVEAFRRAYAAARVAGLEPALRHLANSAAALVVPQARFDLVRVGIAAYGIDPAPGIADMAGVRSRPVMRLRAQLVNVKEIAAGAGVSYGWTWTADRPTTVGLVPLGYADGIPRHASNRAEVAGPAVGLRSGAGSAWTSSWWSSAPASRAEAGEEVSCSAPARRRAHRADWARWSETIGYEIVTRIGARVPRRYRHATPDAG